MKRFFNRKILSFILAILMVCYLIFSNMYYKNIDEAEFREIAWNELTQLDKENVRNARIYFSDTRVEVFNGNMISIPTYISNENTRYVKNDWKYARVEVVKIQRGTIMLIPTDLPNENVRRQGDIKIFKFPKKSILVTFTTNTIFGDIRVFIDPINKGIIGLGVN